MADGDDPIPLADEEENVTVPDEDEPVTPRRAGKAADNEPLPRLWKAEPEPDEDEGLRRKSRRERLAEEKAAREAAGGEKAAKKVKTANAPKDGAKPPGKVLIEATPESETYEARRRARLLIGTAMLGVFGLGIYFLYKAVGGGQSVAPAPDAGGMAAPVAPPKPPGAAEQEAKILLGNAQQLAKNGNVPAAIGVLEKIVKNYPKTATAAEAQEALGRPAKNLPLFLDRPAVVAAPGESTPRAAPPGAPVVNAVPAAPAIKPGSAVARLDLPPNAAEAPGPVAIGPTPNATAVPPRPIPAGFHPRTEAGVHASGWPNQVVSDRDGAVMVLIPAGTYLQGRDNGAPDEAPEHKVTLAAYYIDQHEVTVHQYNLFLKETGAKAPPARVRSKDDTHATVESDELPVGNVTVMEAIAYGKWAGKRLPTEAQWEAAARTPDGRPYPWGSDAPRWNRPREPRQIDPVMAFPLDQSPYGVFDMAGNAQEFTNDWYAPTYYNQFKGRTAENPMGPADPPRRPAQVVVKGVSKAWFVAAREGLKTDTRFPFLGFRCVLTVESGPSTPGAPAANAPKALPTTPGGISPF